MRRRGPLTLKRPSKRRKNEFPPVPATEIAFRLSF